MKRSNQLTDKDYSRLGLCKEYHVLVGETLQIRPSVKLSCHQTVGSWRESVLEFSPTDHGRFATIFSDGIRCYPVEIWVYLDYRAMVKRGPVLGPSQDGWDNGASADCSIFKEGDKYYMFYGGGPKSLPDSHPDMGIGLAVSTDLFHWERYSGNPLLTAGKHSWLPVRETTLLNLPVVTKLRDTYFMYFDVYRHYGDLDVFDEAKPDYEAIGVATSRDLYHWETHLNNPVLSASEPWEGTCVYAPALVTENGLIHMFYTAWSEGNCHLGLATSDDGIHFEKHSGNPIYDCYMRGTWEDHGTPQSQSILKDNGVYWMYYQIKEPVSDGDKCRAALAFSTNFYHWRECPRFAGYDNKCILDVGQPGSIDDVQASPDWMVRRGDTFYLFYHAIRNAPPTSDQPDKWPYQVVTALATYTLPARPK